MPYVTASILARMTVEVFADDDSQVDSDDVRKAIIAAVRGMTRRELTEMFEAAEDVADVDDQDDGNAVEDAWHREECEAES
jgi:hypothetical protein